MTLLDPRRELMAEPDLPKPRSNGGVMRTGVFYRSTALSRLSNADWMTLSSLHIGLDIDLRTLAEINNTSAQTP